MSTAHRSERGTSSVETWREKLVRTAPAVGLLVLCSLLWRAWVQPTLGAGRPALALPHDLQSLVDLHVSGSPQARVGLIVFSDFQCPVCGTFARDVLPVVIEKYVATGKVLLAFSDLPLEAIHPAALKRARIAECAGQQGHFWDTHDRLFANQTSGSVEDDSIAGLDGTLLARCLASESDGPVKARMAKARALGVGNTPTLFIGYVDNERLRVTDAVVGFQSTERLSRLLDQRLRE